jgi:hypothetical protein
VYVDLGASGTVTGVEFMVRRVSGARSYQIRVSEDKRSWTTVASFDYADPLVWQRAQFTASARYVQFVFFNPTVAPSLGYLAEIKVFGTDASFEPASELATATATATSSSTSTLTPAVVEASPIAAEPTEAETDPGTLTPEAQTPTAITEGAGGDSTVIPVEEAGGMTV